jgi:hypothetical protein
MSACVFVCNKWKPRREDFWKIWYWEGLLERAVSHITVFIKLVYATDIPTAVRRFSSITRLSERKMFRRRIVGKTNTQSWHPTHILFPRRLTRTEFRNCYGMNWTFSQSSALFWDVTAFGLVEFHPWRWRQYVPPKCQWTLNDCTALLLQTL